MNPYTLAVNLRNFLYDKGYLKSYKLPIPVISVGNLSLGGSGKTSLVVYIAKHLQRETHVCVLSRGYKRRSKDTVVVSYRGERLCSWEEAGDEPFMMASLLEKASVVVDQDRYRGGLFAAKELGANLIILDDGFQHRRLKRDLDLLLLKREDLHDRPLPFGKLREPLGSIKRASALILSYQDLKEWDYQNPYGIPTFKMFRENWRVVDQKGNTVDTKGKSFVAFSGLANNEQFFLTLKKMGIRLEKTLSFPDHYHYRNFTLQKDKEYITTLKDFVKLKENSNVYYLHFDLKVEGLIEFIRGAYRLHQG